MPDAVLPVCVIIVLNIYGFQRIQSIEASRPENSIRVALIQPAFPQTLIWDSQEDQSRFDDLLKLSEAALQLDVDLLVWPEGAFPGNIDSSKPMWDLLHRYQAWLCFNGTDVDVETLNTDDPTTFNAAFLMNPSGQLKDTYHKRHLVMFGEYVPLEQWFPFLKMLTPIEQLLHPENNQEAFHLPEKDVRFFPLICFEDVMPYLSLEATQEIDYLLNLTNDGWFKDSAAQYQHAGLAAFRSIETGLPMIRCGNNGLTCWIDPAGRRDGLGSFDHSQDIYGRSFRVVDIPKGWKSLSLSIKRSGKYFSFGCFLMGCAIVNATIRKLAQKVQ
jgi:apolipoprotein N-acyltransferase